MNRRAVLGVGGMTALASLAPSARAKADNIRTGMPVLVRHEGRWLGTYTFVSPAGKVNDRYDFDIRVSFADDNERAYRQESFYRWPDGRTREFIFEAGYRDGRVVWDDGRIAGEMWEIDDRTIYLTFRFADQPGVECHEMIQTFEGGKKRGRTWLWYRNNELYQYTLIDEARAPSSESPSSPER